jgi:8-amino-7-oxononanoate synthase
MSSIASFAQKGDVIFADKNLHSCLWDGIRLSMATVERFSHNSPDDLREVAAAANPDAPKHARGRGRVFDGGPHLPPAGIGRHRRGTTAASPCSTMPTASACSAARAAARSITSASTTKVDVICGSLSKSLASTGGFVAASARSSSTCAPIPSRPSSAPRSARARPPCRPPPSRSCRPSPSTTSGSGATRRNTAPS